MSDATTTTAATTAPETALPAPRRPIAIDVHAPGGLQTWVFPPARHVRAVLETGIHPATGRPIHTDPDATCFTCIHAVQRPVADGERTRCALAISRRRGPDLIPTFPACTGHSPRTEATQP